MVSKKWKFFGFHFQPIMRPHGGTVEAVPSTADPNTDSPSILLTFKSVPLLFDFSF